MRIHKVDPKSVLGVPPLARPVEGEGVEKGLPLERVPPALSLGGVPLVPVVLQPLAVGVAEPREARGGLRRGGGNDGAVLDDGATVGGLAAAAGGVEAVKLLLGVEEAVLSLPPPGGGGGDLPGEGQLPPFLLLPGEARLKEGHEVGNLHRGGLLLRRRGGLLLLLRRGGPDEHRGEGGSEAGARRAKLAGPELPEAPGEPRHAAPGGLEEVLAPGEAPGGEVDGLPRGLPPGVAQVEGGRPRREGELDVVDVARQGVEPRQDPVLLGGEGEPAPLGAALPPELR